MQKEFWVIGFYDDAVVMNEGSILYDAVAEVVAMVLAQHTEPDWNLFTPYLVDQAEFDIREIREFGEWQQIAADLMRDSARPS